MKRLRRLRQNEIIRDLVKETRLSVKDFIYPIFVADGENIKTPVNSMPNIYQYSIDRLSEILDKVRESKITGVIIFGIPKAEEKDEIASQAYSDNGVTQRAVRYIKANYPEIYCIVDVCLCEYTSHGHCGMVRDGEILNDETLPLLSKMAVSLVKAGADMVAPSDMMDGRVSAIRQALDEAGYINTPIRRSYQMDFANGKEALREIESDIEEGADIVMVKPALAYLDVLKEATSIYNMPFAVYNVSGEYSMVKAAAAQGWIDEKRIVEENLIAMKRAGAKIIITYHALDMAKWLSEKAN